MYIRGNFALFFMWFDDTVISPRIRNIEMLCLALKWKMKKKRGLECNISQTSILYEDCLYWIKWFSYLSWVSVIVTRHNSALSIAKFPYITIILLLCMNKCIILESIFWSSINFLYIYIICIWYSPVILILWRLLIWQKIWILSPEKCACAYSEFYIQL